MYQLVLILYRVISKWFSVYKAVWSHVYQLIYRVICKWFTVYKVARSHVYQLVFVSSDRLVVHLCLQSGVVACVPVSICIE